MSQGSFPIAVATTGLLIVVTSSAVWAFNQDQSSENDARTSETSTSSYASRSGSLSTGAEPDEVVERVIQGLDANVIESVELGEPPSEIDRAGLWMYANVTGTITKADAHDGSELLPFWQANLAQGAIADQLVGDETNLANVISGATIRLQDTRSRASEILPSDAGDVQTGQVFTAQHEKTSDAEIVSDVESAVAKFGLKPQTRVLRPLGPAVLIVATMDDISGMRGNFHSLLQALQGERGNYEGIYIEIIGPEGALLARSANAYRTGGGAVWFAPGYDQVFGIAHGSLAGEY